MVAGMCVVLLALGCASGVAVASPGIPVPAGDGGSADLEALPPSGLRPLAAGAARRDAGGGRPPRRGGRVRAAWPHRASAQPPDVRLARWLARQTGPTALVRGRSTPIGRTHTPANAGPSAGAAAVASPLLLVRSFDIPTTDPAYSALTNYSWTYDNALAVFAFLSTGEKSEATQLLDQLAALQRTDGSLDFAYDVATGAGAGKARAGSLAWVGLAAAAYRRKYSSTRYDTLIAGVLDATLALRTSDGLVKGGADVAWVSTQHNLLLVGMLRDLVDQLGTGARRLGNFTGAQLGAIQTTMGNAILSKLLVQRGSVASFRAGVGDDAVPVDVQALGAMYLDLRGDARDTQVAGSVLQSGFFVAARAASDAKGVVSGYRPYADATSPNVIWSEGTLETALAFKRVGIVSLQTSLAATSIGLTTLSGRVGPIAGDRNDESRWGEFHTWSASAPASWLLVLNSGSNLLYGQ